MPELVYPYKKLYSQQKSEICKAVKDTFPTP